MMLRYRTRQGFTLIELTIVIMLMLLLVSLVAPLTFKELSKSQAKTEYLTLRNTIKLHTTWAFARGVRYQIAMRGDTMTTKSVLGERHYRFEHLALPEQLFTINANGFPSIDKFELDVAGQIRDITLEDMLGVKQEMIYAQQ